MAVGVVLRSHAGGYLVYLPEHDLTLQCQARGRLKKERVSILTGDRVEIEDLDSAMETGVISTRLERSSLLSRPQIANVDQVVIVQAVRQPEWNQLWCDRYIVHFQLELPDSVPVLCFNKCDLVGAEQQERLRRIYESLGYRVVMVSAKTSHGIEGLLDILGNKITVFAGPSGVGKSSLLNRLEPSLNLKIGVMDHDFGVGRHTTTYSEIYRVHLEKWNIVDSARLTWVADTPGFNLAELRHPDPHDLVFEFPEIRELSEGCRFNNCMHLVEAGCNVLEKLALEENESVEEDGDENTIIVSRERYANYVTMVNESITEHNIRKETSQKKESAVKTVGGKRGKSVNIPRLSGKYRAKSRRTEKQELEVDIPDEEEYQDTTEI
ncbi:MAG: ribosome small subunit-dependent GTPase A [Cyanobacteria bacterium HKST-UBA01]|nr:ribosome small subunit-dependent GTPase A [Cyanobacteria bacterium HKST-UBA01]